MDKILRIDVGASGGPAVKTEDLGDYAGLGGRAMTSAIVSKEVPPTCHPLGDANKLVIAPGLLSGSAAAISGRVSVGCKSPLTGGIKEANSGGQGAQVMGRLGYAAIILEGKASNDSLYKVVINKDGVKLESAEDLKGLGNYATVEKLSAQYGKKVACITIGQAGEMKMSAASIAFTDVEQRPTRHAGRGGVGAVMGSKGIKAIILDDDGMKMRTPADPEKFKAANKAFAKGLRKHPVTGEGLPAFGTNVLTNVVNEAGGYPTHNFKTGQFDGASNISGETQAALENERGGEGSATHGCHRGV
jgi:aldehyde:ferredoxin oxidoreductase